MYILEAFKKKSAVCILQFHHILEVILIIIAIRFLENGLNFKTFFK